MNLILLGAPGAGKGTQAALISKELGLLHLASGDLFREEVAKGSELGKVAKSYMDKGLLVPDDLAIKMILGCLASLPTGRGCILDGFPRTLEQAQALDKALKTQGRAIDKVVYLKVSTEELVRRLSGRWICRQCQAPYHLVSAPPRVAGRCDKCGGELYQRDDDKEQTVRKRLEVYLSQTAPLLQYYGKDGRLLEIKGEGSLDKVKRECLSALGKKSTSSNQGRGKSKS